MLLRLEESQYQTKLFGKQKLDNVSLISRNLPKTVFARALADVIQRAHRYYKHKQTVDIAIILFTQCPLYLCYFSRS